MGHEISLSNQDGTGFTAYLASPDGQPVGGVIVIHEVWGLVGNITGIADRFAAEGYVAIAPDLLGRVGLGAELGLELQRIIFSGDPEARSTGQPRLRAALAPTRVPEFSASAVESLRRSVDRLLAEPGVEGRVAVTGFCFGGSYSFSLAAADPRIRAAVPFYGAAPEVASTIGCPVLAFYGTEDRDLIDALPAVTTAMREGGVDFRPQVYEGVGHAFFNDTNAYTFDATAAEDAWRMTLAFLAHELDRAPGAPSD